jgi:hypothetical protein
MALTSRRRLCLLDMASSLIVIPSADCPIHNVPIVTLCVKQITFRTMILRCASRTGCAALHNLQVWHRSDAPVAAHTSPRLIGITGIDRNH